MATITLNLTPNEAKSVLLALRAFNPGMGPNLPGARLTALEKVKAELEKAAE